MRIPRRVLDRTVTLALAGLLLIQGFLLLRRSDSGQEREAGAAVILPGDTISRLVGLNQMGETVSVEFGSGREKATVILAFGSGCAWCERAAPVWREWLSGQELFRVIALSSDVPELAFGFAARNGWEVEVLSVSEALPGSTERALVKYVPWAFIFDSLGVLIHQQAGTELTSLSSHFSGRAE